MARPRTPSNVLDLRGAFKKDPKRKRVDARGKRGLEKDPPTHLDQEFVVAWRYIVERLPMITVYDCDEVAVEMAARCLAGIWKLGATGLMSPTFKSLNGSLLQYLNQLGMTPRARTQIPFSPPPQEYEPINPFEKLKTEEKDSR